MRFTTLGAILCALTLAAGAQASLRFFGHGVDMIDRVKIQLDDPDLPSDPGPPADVGATDFTLEFFMKASDADNVQGGSVVCNATNIDWIFGNIVFDRDRFNQGRKFGISIADSGPLTGVIVFGVTGDGTGDYNLCGTSDVLDGEWHHIAVQRRRSDGLMSVYVDGVREGIADGPDGDISYPDDGDPLSFCGLTGSEPCDDSDPFLVMGAEKHDAGSQFPSYNGFLDEVRLSDTLRYTLPTETPPSQPFVSDGSTVALYALEGSGDCTGTVADSSGASGGPSDGECRFGGSLPAGPIFSDETPFPLRVPASSPGVRALLALLLTSCVWIAYRTRARQTDS